jgi:hypothetical protein
MPRTRTDRRVMTANRYELLRAIDQNQVHKFRDGCSYWLRGDDNAASALDVTENVLLFQQWGWAGFRAHDHPDAIWTGGRPVALTDLGSELFDHERRKARADA